MEDCWVLRYAPYIALRQQLRKNAFGDLPVFEHVTYAAGCAQVVFLYIKRAIAIADQVYAGYMHINIIRHGKIMHFPQVMLAAVNHGRRYNAILYNKLVAVNIF